MNSGATIPTTVNTTRYPAHTLVGSGAPTASSANPPICTAATPRLPTPALTASAHPLQRCG